MRSLSTTTRRKKVFNTPNSRQLKMHRGLTFTTFRFGILALFCSFRCPARQMILLGVGLALLWVLGTGQWAQSACWGSPLQKRFQNTMELPCRFLLLGDVPTRKGTRFLEPRCWLAHCHHYSNVIMASILSQNRFGAHGDVMSASPDDDAGKTTLCEEIKNRARYDTTVIYTRTTAI